MSPLAVPRQIPVRDRPTLPDGSLAPGGRAGVPHPVVSRPRFLQRVSPAHDLDLVSPEEEVREMATWISEERLNRPRARR